MVIENLSGNFHLRTEITKVNRGVPLTLTNPWYKDILAEYNHLREVEMDDVDLKRELPVLRKILISLRIIIWWHNRYNC